MIYLSSPSVDPYFNLALEQYVFDQMPKDQSYFMLWQNDNTIVVGKYQNTAEEIDSAFTRARDIRVVRRQSGGGAVYHDLGNLNFTFITSQETLANGFDFRRFTAPVLRTLAGLGVPADFDSRNDLVIQGRKFSGNAQYIRQGRVMHHGTLLFDSDLDVLGEALRVGEDKYVSKSMKSVRSRVCNIREYLDPGASLRDFQQRLIEEVGRETPLTPYVFQAADLAQAETIAAQRYRTWEWNYGRSPDYNVKKTRRFPGGLLQAEMMVAGGVIRSLRLYGDFFGNEVDQLEQRLTNVELADKSILACLAGCDVNDCIYGLDAEALTRILVD